jgi:hypothetical protein
MEDWDSAWPVSLVCDVCDPRDEPNKGLLICFGGERATVPLSPLDIADSGCGGEASV